MGRVVPLGPTLRPGGLILGGKKGGPRPGPRSTGEEAGLVLVAARRRGGRLICRKCRYGGVGRERVRTLAAHAALEMLGELLGEG